jgi:hypothetical protein
MWGPLGALTPEFGDNDSLATVAQPWVYEPLARLDDGGALVPALASRVVRVAPGRFEVQIRSGATFSDGSAVTASDIVDCFARKARVTSTNGMLEIESVVSGLATEAILSAIFIHRRRLGTGPFAVESADAVDLHLRRRRPEPLKVNDVHVLAFATPREAFSHALKGDANVVPDLEPRWVEFFRGVPSLKVIRGRGIATESIVFTTRLSRQERRAIAARLERSDIRTLAYGDECAESTDGAASEDEIPRGSRLEILSWGPFERLATAARRGLGARAGEIVHAPISTALRRLHAREFDLLTLRPLVSPPMMTARLWRTGAPDNPSGYTNAAVDRALDAGDWAAARAAMREDPPAAFICTRDRLAVVDARIRNPRLGPSEFFETLPDWEVAQ